MPAGPAGAIIGVALGGATGELVVRQGDGPGDLYEVYLKYGHTYKLDVGTTNYFGGKDPADQGPIQGRLGIVLHAYNAYILDLANCLVCTNRPDSIYRARPTVLVPSGQIVCRYFKPGTPANIAGNTSECLFKALADTAYSVEVFVPAFGNRTAPWHQVPQYSLTVREVP